MVKIHSHVTAQNRHSSIRICIPCDNTLATNKTTFYHLIIIILYALYLITMSNNNYCLFEIKWLFTISGFALSQKWWAPVGIRWRKTQWYRYPTMWLWIWKGLWISGKYLTIIVSWFSVLISNYMYDAWRKFGKEKSSPWATLAFWVLSKLPNCIITK